MGVDEQRRLGSDVAETVEGREGDDDPIADPGDVDHGFLRALLEDAAAEVGDHAGVWAAWCRQA